MTKSHASSTSRGAGSAAQPMLVTVAELRDFAGKHLGYSGWREIPQRVVDWFAEATGDRQWIHVDQEHAARGPFGSTVVHGFLTLAHSTALLEQVLGISDAVLVLNYGLNRVRFPGPLRAGGRVRMGVELGTVEEFVGGAQTEYKLTFEAEGEEKPCCVATLLFRYYSTLPAGLRKPKAGTTSRVEQIAQPV
ncbi:MAG: MaoC family dehydratase [Actinomycetota bacterium]